MPRYAVGAVVFVAVGGIVGDAETPSPPSRSYAATFMTVVVDRPFVRPARESVATWRLLNVPRGVCPSVRSNHW
jgi:hypothetical protein